MSSSFSIRVPERGNSDDIPAEVWSRMSDDAAFWRLVDSRRIKVGHPGRRRVRLEGTSYVGRAIAGDVRIDVVEKIEGALAALLKFATHSAFRVDRIEGPVTELGDLTSLLMRQFLYAVKTYASEGREFRYSKRSMVGSLAGGHMDLIGTIALRARGMRHLIAFDKVVIDRRTPLNRIVLAGLREAENLAPLINLSGADLATARGLSVLFEDCRDIEVVFGRREDLASAARRLAENTEFFRHRDLLMLASVILSHVGFEQTDPLQGNLPRAWFLNLETLFETAVRQVMQDLLRPGAGVAKAPEPKPPIFERRKLLANPDLVISSAVGVLAVGDVKYKDVSGEPWTKKIKRADLYQLLLHGAAYAAPVCFLIYPHDRFLEYELGKSATGSRTWAFAIDIKDIPGSLRKAAETMGLIAGGLEANA
jgi:5-methylcytosine-specific restriction endonuclease McrBC regulatory subunit McrC